MTGCQPPAFLVLQVLLQLKFVCFFSAETVEVFSSWSAWRLCLLVLLNPLPCLSCVWSRIRLEARRSWVQARFIVVICVSMCPKMSNTWAESSSCSPSTDSPSVVHQLICPAASGLPRDPSACWPESLSVFITQSCWPLSQGLQVLRGADGFIRVTCFKNGLKVPQRRGETAGEIFPL